MVFAILSSLVSLPRELYDACTAAFRLLLAFFSFLYGALNVIRRPPPLESMEIYTGLATLFPPLLHQLNLTWQAAAIFGLHLLCLPPRALVIAIEAVKVLHPLDSSSDTISNNVCGPKYCALISRTHCAQLTNDERAIDSPY